MSGQHERPKEMEDNSRFSNVDTPTEEIFQDYREVHLQS